MAAQAFFGIILLEVCLFIIYCTWCDRFIIVIYTHTYLGLIIRWVK